MGESYGYPKNLVVLDRIRFHLLHQLERDGLAGIDPELELAVDGYAKEESDAIALFIGTHLLGIEKERIFIHEQWPADWWQAFRERWFPWWWLRWRPVRYSEVFVDRPIYGGLCPHLKSPGAGMHVKWMVEAEMRCAG